MKSHSQHQNLQLLNAAPQNAFSNTTQPLHSSRRYIYMILNAIYMIFNAYMILNARIRVGHVHPNAISRTSQRNIYMILNTGSSHSMALHIQSSRLIPLNSHGPIYWTSVEGIPDTLEERYRHQIGCYARTQHLGKNDHGNHNEKYCHNNAAQNWRKRA